jgi:subtilisin
MGSRATHALRTKAAAALAAASLVAAGSLGTPSEAADTELVAAPLEAVVVVLHDEAPAIAAALQHRSRHGIVASRVFTQAVNGYSTQVTPAQRRALASDPAVRFVATDIDVEMAGKRKPLQLLPTGVNRIEGELSSAVSGDGAGVVDVDVAIIDGGFDLDHPDLDLRPGADCRGAGFSSKNNHGTGAGGVIGARDNGEGVVGVAPGARLWAVDAFDDLGRAPLSSILCGVEWVIAHAGTIDVVNMSFTTLGHDDGRCGAESLQALHIALCRLVDAGVTPVAAAGNEGVDASSRAPAAYEQVITVSAIADFDGVPGGLGIDCLKNAPVQVLDDTFAYFSNHGTPVDIAAPGMCIRSADQGGGYTLYDGTSFAAPHVAGAAALYLASHPTASPRTVRRLLVQSGRFDYDAATDPDGVQEPLLDVSGL